MPFFITGPIENRAVNGTRPTQQVVVTIVNGNAVNPSFVLIEGFALSDERELIIQELIAVAQNAVVTKNYSVDFEGYEFDFGIEGPAAAQTEVSIWGRRLGGLVAAHRIVLAEIKEK